LTAIEPTPATYELTSGITLAADHWGDPTGMPVVFLHGGGQTRHSWGGTAAALATRGIFVVTVDLRGHGDSSWSPDGTYGLESYAADNAALISQLGQPAVLVGASLGGLTGMTLEGTVAPGSLRGLALVDIVPRMNHGGASRILQFMTSNMADGFASLDEVADAIAEYNPHRPRPSTTDGLKKNLRERDGRWYWHWDPATLPIDPDEIEVSLDRRNADDLADALARVTVPVLLIRGRRSDLVTEDELADFQVTYPDASVIDVSEAGHMVAGDKNDLFTDAVTTFVEQFH